MIDAAQLRENEADLAEALLPEDPDPTEPLPQKAGFLTHAYLVLACAIIEEFIENCFEQFVVDATAAAGDSYAGCFVTLAARFSGDLIGQHAGALPPARIAAPVLQGLYSSKVVRVNNGLKRRNVEALAKPLGLLSEIEDKCESLLGPADALGAKRGAVAHIGNVTEEIRPHEARALVSEVLDNLDSLIKVLEL